jgi:hypothetical protein
MALEWKELSCSARNGGCSSASIDKSHPRMKSINEKSIAVVSLDEETGTKRSGDLPDDAGSSDVASMDDLLWFSRNHSSQKSRRVVCLEDEGEVGNVIRNRERKGGGIEREIDMGESIMELDEVANKIRWLKGLLCFGDSSWLGPPPSKWKFLSKDPTPTSDYCKTNVKQCQ